MTYKIEIELTDLEARVWAMFVIDPQEATEVFVRNEVRRCQDTVYQEELERLMADPDVKTIPADRDAIIGMSERKSAQENDQALLDEIKAQTEGQLDQ